MSDFPNFADLRTLADELRKQPEFARLSSRIDKALKTQSCLADLREARACLSALEEMLPSPRKRNSETRHATEAALIRSCVTLYERATNAAGKRKERGSINIHENLSPDQLRDHQAIVSLRQRSIAHVYPGESVNGAKWHDDRIFAVEMDKGWRAAAASHRIQFQEATYLTLKRQIPVAEQIMYHKFQERMAELVASLNDTPVEQAAFLRHTFDPVSYFGSHEGVLTALEGQRTGTSSLFK